MLGVRLADRSLIVGLVGLVALARKGRLVDVPPLSRAWLVPAAVLPFVANSAGWVFTEMGRQPWVVFGLLKTSARELAERRARRRCSITLVGFTLLYGVLAADRRAASSSQMARKGPVPEGDGATRPRRADLGARLLTMDDYRPYSRPSGSSSSRSCGSGYFVLEGFDFGVGMLLRRRRAHDRPSAAR